MISPKRIVVSAPLNPTRTITVTKVGPAGPRGEGLNFLGTKSTYAELDQSYVGSEGDTYVLEDTGHAWKWGGSSWVDLGRWRGPSELSMVDTTGFTGLDFLRVKSGGGIEGRTPAEVLSGIGAEPALGNPATSGWFLSSDDQGNRSWSEVLLADQELNTDSTPQFSSASVDSGLVIGPDGAHITRTQSNYLAIGHRAGHNVITIDSSGHTNFYNDIDVDGVVKTTSVLSDQILYLGVYGNQYAASVRYGGVFRGSGLEVTASGKLNQRVSTASSPSLLDFPVDKDGGFHLDTVSGDLVLAHNDNGTLKKVFLSDDAQPLGTGASPTFADSVRITNSGANYEMGVSGNTFYIKRVGEDTRWTAPTFGAGNVAIEIKDNFGIGFGDKYSPTCSISNPSDGVVSINGSAINDGLGNLVANVVTTPKVTSMAGSLTLKCKDNFNYVYIEGSSRYVVIDDTRFNLGQNSHMGWSTGAANTEADLTLYKDDPDILAQRNSTNPQEFRIYNAYTDSSNYERMSMGWDSNIFYFRAQKAGTGSLRTIRFDANEFTWYDNGNLVFNASYSRIRMSRVLECQQNIRPISSSQTCGESSYPWATTFTTRVNQRTESAGNPTTTEYPADGDQGDHWDSAAGKLYHVHNKGGTLYTVEMTAV